jgi:hypothetical protein
MLFKNGGAPLLPATPVPQVAPALLQTMPTPLDVICDENAFARMRLDSAADPEVFYPALSSPKRKHLADQLLLDAISAAGAAEKISAIEDGAAPSMDPRLKKNRPCDIMLKHSKNKDDGEQSVPSL